MHRALGRRHGDGIVDGICVADHAAGQPGHGIAHFGDHGRARVSVVVAVDRAAGLAVGLRPLPCAEDQEAVAGQVGGRTLELLGGGGGVQGEDFAGLIAIELSNGQGEILGRELADAQHRGVGHLLGVPAHHERHMRLLSGGKRFHRVLGVEVAVDDAGELVRLHPLRQLQQLLGGDGAQLCQRWRAHFFGEGKPLLFGGVQRLRREAAYPAACADGARDQVLGQGRNHLGVDGDGAG